jgi:SAM-dependent methyltransferase
VPPDPGQTQPSTTRGASSCRFCDTPLTHSVVDLGMSPFCETLVTREQLEQPETFYPLHVRVCDACWLVQIPEFVPPGEIFGEYAYFSAYSDSWVEHARRYAETATDRFGLGPGSLVVELASNDGYLLQHFVAAGVPVLGIDPARNVVEAALARGVPTLAEFFGAELAARLVSEGTRADLVIGNNVLAQVPDLNDFVAGVKTLLAPGGTATFEFPHLTQLLDHVEYDTIYHEHYSYFSLGTVREIFAHHGLATIDVEELTTHGGSLRVFFGHVEEGRDVTPAVAALAAQEEARGLRSLDAYSRFGAAVDESKRALLEFLVEERRAGHAVAGYGAPGKGNTLLNFCGIRTDFLDFTVDRNPYKHGKFTPGTHIPIHPPEAIAEARPDVIVILPWNLAAEIAEQLSYTSAWGARLVIPIPRPTPV